MQALVVAAGLQLILDPLSWHDAGCVLSFGAAGTLVAFASLWPGQARVAGARRSRWRQALRALGRDPRRDAGDRTGAAADHRPMVPRGHRGRAHRQRARRACDGRGAGGRSRAPSGRECLARTRIGRRRCGDVRRARVAAKRGRGRRRAMAGAGGAAARRCRARTLLHGAHGHCRRARTREMPRCRWVRRSRTAKAECRECRTPGHSRAPLVTTAAGAASASVAMGCLVWIVMGGVEHSLPTPWTWPAAERWQRASWPDEPWLLITVLDVGQGDATVVRFPSGRTWLVDAGGSAAETFDTGERVTLAGAVGARAPTPRSRARDARAS